MGRHQLSPRDIRTRLTRISHHLLETWHRNPHARWTTRPEDVAELAQIQLRLLRHAVSALKPGGRLIYAVCTLTRAETTAIADALTHERLELDRLPLPSVLPSAQCTPACLWLDGGARGGERHVGRGMAAARFDHHACQRGGPPL
ncbi:MAG TPA: hypothetical protein PKK20_04885 [Verrucomicrobiota bacterium]|nr:hypothetical protein [Verrucomicrobiota bacterium]HNU99254.1 hypothetical protein [Verrucomicrobiota bacterium]HOA61387.1 hypothetical protein [Verrucomicrobiota bacterium]HOF47133.1 hypothetical protein [Verrucomicrobiota bacterium]HOG86324.1 hypothetical protein [Verrucomicrobiota bacterium]